MDSAVMSPDRDALLCRQYPALFAKRHLATAVTAMGRGFSCDDGWFALIDDLCLKLQAAADSGQIQQPVVEQVKEKFGELRFYAWPQSLPARALIAQARALSAVTCEVCGAAGVLRYLHGFQTVCDLHAEARQHDRSTTNGTTMTPSFPPFYLFLDVDGVLHDRRVSAVENFEFADRLGVVLARYPEVLVVVSSSMGRVSPFANLQGACGPLLGPRLHDFTPIVKRVIDGVPPFHRFVEIAYWLATHPHFEARQPRPSGRCPGAPRLDGS